MLMQDKYYKLRLNDNSLYNVKIIEDLKEDDLFYKEVYVKAANQMNFMLEHCIFNKKKLSDFENVENPNNILAFIGDRGQGKTSAMLSFELSLINHDTKLLGNKIEQYTFEKIGVIDPSTFEDFSNLIDIILSRMYKRFTQKYEQKERASYDLNGLKEIKKVLIKKFQEAYKYLNLITTKNHGLKPINIYDQVLENLTVIGDTSNFKKILSDLIFLYLQFMTEKENSVLILTIDDLDLDIRHSYQIVELIRKYLILPNVIILIAVKIEQLHRGIRMEYAKHMDSSLPNEPYNMATTYLRKIIPENRRIYMPALCSDMEDLVNDVRLVLNNKEKMEFKDTVSDLLYRKTSIVSMNFGKRKKFLFNGNLRELIELYSLLSDMEDPLTTLKSRNEAYLMNIKKFKEYFVYNWCTTNLNQEESHYIKEIDKYSLFLKNRKVLKILRKILFKSAGKSQSDLDKIFVNKGIFDQNYTLLDVYEGLEKLKEKDYSVGIENVGKFAYAIQFYYSIIMNQLYYIDFIVDSQNLKDRNINYLSQFIGKSVMSAHTLNNFKNKGEVLTYKLDKVPVDKDRIRCLDLFITLICKKTDDNQKIDIYSHRSRYHLEYEFDFSDIFFRGLDLEYSILYYDDDTYEAIISSSIYIGYANAIKRVSKYILCNFDVYAFYVQWMNVHIKEIKPKANILTVFLQEYISFLEALDKDIKLNYNFDSQSQIQEDLLVYKRFLFQVQSNLSENCNQFKSYMEHVKKWK